MTKVVLSGADNPTWRLMLEDLSVPAVGFDVGGILTRKGEKYLIADKVGPDTEVWVNGSVKDGSTDDATDFWRVVNDNADRIHRVIEYSGVNPEVRERLRFGSDIQDKIIPVWQPSDGAEVLERLAVAYPTIAMPRTALKNRRGAAATSLDGLRLRGVKILVTGAGLSDLSDGRVDIALTSAWTLPRRYGEAVVFTGTQVTRCPPQDASYEPELLHKSKVSPEWREDFDDLCRLAALSCLEIQTIEPSLPVSSELGVQEDKPDIEGVTYSPAVLPLTRRPAKPLPIVSQERQLLVCNRCTLAAVCPEATPNAECAFEIPATLKTREDVDHMFRTLLEIQAKRVLWGAFAEQVRGGEHDESVGKELDRYMRMSKSVKDIQDENSYTDLHIRTKNVEQKINPLASIFGADMTAEMDALDEPIDARAALEEVSDKGPR